MRHINRIGAHFFTILILCGCQSSVPNEREISNAGLKLNEVFTVTDAEKILGEPVQTMDSATTRDDHVITYKCTYSAESPDHQTDKRGVIYIMIEQFDQDSSAINVYTAIKEANETHEGFQLLHDLGNEAYYHSDGGNFMMIMARKGGVVFRMKVGKITGRTSAVEFNRTAKKVVRLM